MAGHWAAARGREIGPVSRTAGALMEPVYDAVVIGSGAGGGPLAARLSQAGWNVVLLEKGPFRQREEYPLDEVASLWRDFFVPSLADEPHMLVQVGNPLPQPTFMGWIGNSVGGGTVRMGGFFYRF